MTFKVEEKKYEVEEILSDFGKDGYELVMLLVKKFQ